MHNPISVSRLRYPWLAFGAALLLALTISSGRVSAQGDNPPAPSPTPAAGSDSSGASLFPNPGSAPELEENSASYRAAHHASPGGGHRHGLGNGNRANDLLTQQAANAPVETRIAFRKVKTEVLLRHPELNVLEQQAADARTDNQKRDYLRAYYTQLYADVRKRDPSKEMADHVTLLGEIARQRYQPQRRAVGGEEDLIRGRHNRKRN